MDQHEAAAADVARPRQGHGKREPHGHRRIDGIAPGLQDVAPDLGRHALLRRHHAMGRDDRVKPVHGRQQSRVLRPSGGTGQHPDKTQPQPQDAHTDPHLDVLPPDWQAAGVGAMPGRAAPRFVTRPTGGI